MKMNKSQNLRGTLAAMVLAGSTALSSGQEFPPGGPVLAPNDGVVYGPMENGQRSNPHAPGSEIVSLVRNADGNDLTIVGEPFQLLTIWASDDYESWEYVVPAAEIEPGLYLATDEEGAQSKARFYLVVKPRGQKPCNPPQHAQNLVNSVANWDWLNQQQRVKVIDACTAVAAAYANFNQKSNELNHCLRLLADCLKEVARLRLEAQAADKAAKDAEATAADAEADAQAERDKLSDLNDELADEEAKRDQWEREMLHLGNSIQREEALLAITTNPTRRADIAAGIVGLRVGFQERLARRNASLAKIAEIKGKIADQAGPVAAAEAAAATAKAAADAARAAADAAQQAYEDAKRRCEELKDHCKTKQEEVDQAKSVLDGATDDFGTAQEEAATAGAAAREAAAAAAAQAAADERAAHEAAERRERERVEAQQEEFRKFMQDLAEFVGEERAAEIGGKVFGPLTHGTGAAVRAGAGLGATTSVLQAGWAAIVKWAQKAAEAATAKMARKRAAEVAARDWVDSLGRNPSPGKFKHSNLKNSQGEVVQTFFMVANADGSVTVYSYSKQTGEELMVCVVKP